MALLRGGQRQCWKATARMIMSLEEPRFKVSSKPLQDRYTFLVKKFEAKRTTEDKWSWFSLDPSEKDKALLDLIGRFREADEKHQRKRSEKKLKVKHLENKKSWKDLDNRDGGTKIAPRSSTDLDSYLIEISEKSYELRQKELWVKQEEINVQAQNQQTWVFTHATTKCFKEHIHKIFWGC